MTYPSKRIVSLFTGIGGFDLGFQGRCGHVRLMCEIDPVARAVLRTHFPDIEIVEDVAALKELPAETELLTMGFPCQDLSQAGSRAGISRTFLGHRLDCIETDPTDTSASIADRKRSIHASTCWRRSDPPGHG